MEENMEMSTLDKYLPRYYKGYDVDVLLDKIDHRKPLTPEEGVVFDEVMDVYYKKEFERREKMANQRKETAIGGKFSIHHIVSINNPFVTEFKRKNK